MEYTKAHNIPGILVSLDLWKYLRTLDNFNFGTSIKRWVITLYANIESVELNNHFLTICFRPSSRGVRQGCPLSPYLFILSAETMSDKLLQEPSIKEIKISGKEMKIKPIRRWYKPLISWLGFCRKNLGRNWKCWYNGGFKIGPQKNQSDLAGKKIKAMLYNWNDCIVRSKS